MGGDLGSSACVLPAGSAPASWSRPSDARHRNPHSSDVAELIRLRTRDRWEELFRDVDACIEVVRTGEEAFLHPQATHRGQTVDELQPPFALDAGSVGSSRALGEPLKRSWMRWDKIASKPESSCSNPEA